MAEGGVEVYGGRKIICNICEEGGLSVKAYQFCVSCEQYLCKECKQYHSRVKVTKSHKIIGANAIPTLTSLTLGSEAVETPTCKDHERPITYFCISHMTKLCQSCRVKDHKICINVTEFEKAVHDVFTEGHVKRIRKSLEEMIDSFSKCKDNAQSNRDQLYKSKQSAIDDVKQVRMTIDSHLDKIEAAAYEDIERLTKKEIKQVEDQLHVCNVTIHQLQKRLSKLERAMTLDDKESEFVTINNVTKEVKQHCNLLKSVQYIIENTFDIEITCIVNDSIGKISQTLPRIGNLSVTKLDASQIDHGTVTIYTGELKPRNTTDTKAPAIRSYKMLPDGKQLITNGRNNMLELYDSHNQFLSGLVLSDRPWSGVLLSDTEAIVSLPNITSLHYIAIGSDLAVSKTKKVDYHPVAMVKYGDDILTTIYDRFWKVVVIDNHGTVKRVIYKDNGSLFSKPYYIGLSVDHRNVYFVDKDKGCIGLSMDGNVVFEYQDQTVQHYAGLAVGRNCLFIGVKQGYSYKVRRLSLSGGDLEDLDLGDSVPLEIENNILIIFKSDDKGDWSINFFYLL